jgi:hypothetical protein
LAVTILSVTNFRHRSGRKLKVPNRITTSIYLACK